MCTLLNLIVEGKAKKGEQGDDESIMDLDENEREANDDHEKSQDQLDGGTGKTLRRRWVKHGGWTPRRQQQARGMPALQEQRNRQPQKP